MNFDRDRRVGAAGLALLTLLTLSSCGGQKAAQPTASTSENTSPSAIASPYNSGSTSENTSPSAIASPFESTSPDVSTTASEAGVKPQGTSCPADAPIKGKIRGSKKIYHLPKSRGYANIKPEECFPTEAAAKAAGFRAPRQSKG